MNRPNRRPACRGAWLNTRHSRAGISLLGTIATFVAFCGPTVQAGYIIGSFDLARGGFDSLADAPEQAAQRALIQSYRGDVVFTSTNVLTPGYLSTVHALTLGGQTSNSTTVSPLSLSEQTALFNFVAAGGELLLATDNGDLDGATGDASRASFLNPFGMASNLSGISNPSATVVDLASPISDGPFGTIASIGVSNSGWYTSLGPYAHTVAVEDQFGNPMLTTIDFDVIGPGSGRMVAIADSDAFSSVLLSANILAYLVPVPEPNYVPELVVLIVGFVAFAALRRHRQRSAAAH